ncbi:MAG: helix-hairpin-helix domain-containing protein [Betaproteobacteria bacterium]|nr:mitomycin resistance protein [Betaproteobacteria bacterium]MDE2047851.1 helix-hairpin-helix domain-containing protein [Betaproteobacteria bacterium]
MSGKAQCAAEVRRFTDIPNIGPAMAADFALLGLRTPQQLAQREPLQLYEALCRKTGVRQDPCVLDTFMAAVDFMRGAPPRPWWHYTAQRKAMHNT